MRDVPAKWRHLYKQAVARAQGRPMQWDKDPAWQESIREAKERHKAERGSGQRTAAAPARTEQDGSVGGQ